MIVGMFSAICAGEQEECGNQQDPAVELPDVHAVAVDDLSNTQIRIAIDEFIRSERDRAILKRRLIDGITFEKLAEEFDLSVRQVKTIVYRGREKVFAHIR